MNLKKLISRRAFLYQSGALSVSIFAGGGVVSSLFAASKQPADIVYRNARIYTINPQQPWATYRVRCRAISIRNTATSLR